MLIAFLLIAANVLISYKGFKSSAFFDRYQFEVDKILLYKDYKRLVTSGFLHINWMHLLFNMFSLYFFSGVVEATLGPFNFLLIYFASLVGGGLLSLLIHRQEGDYSSAGASGAVCGILFASVALYPEMGIQLFPLPISIPSWLYAIAYVLFTIYAVRSQKYNVGHDAHLGGALVGLVLAVAMHPSVLRHNYPEILIIMVPSVIFIYVIVNRPGLLLVDNLFYKTHHDAFTIDHKYNMERADEQQEIDRILDKINRKGMRSLNKKERERLKDYSKHVR